MIAQSSAFRVSPVTLELRAGLSALEVDRRIALAHRGGDLEAMAKAFYLVDLAERRGYQELGFHSIIQYGVARYHMRPSTTRSYLAVGRALRDLPMIHHALGEGRLFWSQVRELVRVATPETEHEWIEAAHGLSARQLVTAVSLRRKGERPGDPTRRRIHNATFKVPGRLNALQWAKWNNARAKLEAELGRPVSDDEIHEHMIDLLLSTRPDGSVPGRIAVNDSHYTTVVFHDVVRGVTSVESEDGRLPLDPQTSRSFLRQAGRSDLAETIDDEDENSGPEVPIEDRDVETPECLRREILIRDGFRCLCCGLRTNLTVHHKQERRFGGMTVPWNLLTLCEGCHSLVHEGLLFIRGTIASGLRFLDARGNELRRLAEGVQAQIGVMRLVRGPDESATRVAPPEDSQRATRVAPPDDSQRATRVARMRGLDGLVGQSGVVANLRRAIRAARKRGEPAPHILLAGGTGLGKTSLAEAVAGEMGLGGEPRASSLSLRRPCHPEAEGGGAGFHVVCGPLLREPEDLLDRLAMVRDGDILFVDEIHRMPDRVAETLYAAIDAGRRFTLIGATTDEDLVPGPLRSRFRIRADLEFYSVEEIMEILRREAGRLGIGIDLDAARLLAGASHDTPRDALSLLSVARDEAQIRDLPTIDVEIGSTVMNSLGIDEQGLSRIQREYLAALAGAGGPLSLGTLSDRLGKSPYAIKTVQEPFLIRRGLVARTPRGRVLLKRMP